MNVCHLSHEVYSVHNVIFYSTVNSSTQKLFLFIVFHLPHPLNGVQFISLGFLIYIYFVQKFAKPIFNSVILAQLIVLLSAISSFMCNHLSLKKLFPPFPRLFIFQQYMYVTLFFFTFSTSMFSPPLLILLNFKVPNLNHNIPFQ
jgi:hypothetical protein